MLRWNKCVLVLFILSCLIIGSISAQTLEQKFDEYLNASVNVNHFSGTVLVAKGGKVLFSKGYGMADMEKKIPNTSETKYLIGSITKTFTATAIMQLIEQKKIGLYDTLTKYIPEYPVETGGKITIRHLLSHTSGIPNHTGLPEFISKRFKPFTHEELLALFKDLPLEFSPGSEFNYSNSGYFLLGLIIEKVSGLSYGEYLSKNIFEPLGMKNSGYMNYAVNGLANGYQLDPENNIIPSEKVDPSVPFSAGGLYSTAGDMLIWDQALYGSKILSQETLSKMWTRNLGLYGYGWVIDSIFNHKRIWHNGAIDGYISGFQRLVDDSICVIVLCNNSSILEHQISASLDAMLLDQTYVIPVSKKAISINISSLAEYIGVYQIEPKLYRLIARRGDSLYAMHPGGTERLVLPEAKDKFFYDYDNSIEMEFIRDKAGRIIEQKVGQGKLIRSATRISGPTADSLLTLVEVKPVDPSEYDIISGSYQLAPTFVIEIRKKGNKIFAQATAQPELEIFPRTNFEYYYKVVDAQFSFVRDTTGAVTGIILHQGGRNLPGKKIK